jgi:hypothetical protein
MTKLVYVGPNRKRIGGISSKAYTIRRRGKAAVARWGAVEVVGGGGGKYRWYREPKEKRWPLSTEVAAHKEVGRRIAEKERKGYKRLPWHHPIRRPQRGKAGQSGLGRAPSVGQILGKQPKTGSVREKMLFLGGGASGAAALIALWRWFHDDGDEGAPEPPL